MAIAKPITKELNEAILAVLQETKKKIGEYSHTNGHVTKVYKLSGEHDEGDPYKVELHKNGKHYEPADYFTNDKDDAHGTAQHMVKEDINESDLEEAVHPAIAHEILAKHDGNKDYYAMNRDNKSAIVAAAKKEGYKPRSNHPGGRSNDYQTVLHVQHQASKYKANESTEQVAKDFAKNSKPTSFKVGDNVHGDYPGDDKKVLHITHIHPDGEKCKLADHNGVAQPNFRNISNLKPRAKTAVMMTRDERMER
jgi:hypothetical protein